VSVTDAEAATFMLLEPPATAAALPQSQYLCERALERVAAEAAVASWKYIHTTTPPIEAFTRRRTCF